MECQKEVMSRIILQGTDLTSKSYDHWKTISKNKILDYAALSN